MQELNVSTVVGKTIDQVFLVNVPGLVLFIHMYACPNTVINQIKFGINIIHFTKSYTYSFRGWGVLENDARAVFPALKGKS